MAKGIVIGIAATLLCGFAVWLGIVYAGAYNVAASDAHTDVLRWTLDTTMHRSVSARAEQAAIDLPERFSPDLIQKGATHYADTCELCHGGPGVDPSAWSRAMRPEPPHLHEAAAEWSDEEIYWIVENGIKMTGMPAFGTHHDGEELAAITAFVSRLPGLSNSEYAELTSNSHGEHHHE